MHTRLDNQYFTYTYIYFYLLTKLFLAGGDLCCYLCVLVKRNE